ncbi:HK97 family phage prohead protease [Xanthobacter dioxanivorans]|uniref:HK97 family phage prohead protease n=1 Tax=Xanthobacter dioxanivorans TaxID=2528964 RepID=A0A974SLR0_9HYPH|nr:HK97 family phage prohead protease [Xanthobacter dioxanivorans]QRG08813.1 HK97 family phage prohead protease [Xanthobacter dioxanivorans]
MNRLEIKSTFTVDDTGAIEGVAWPFGTPDRVGDVIEKGAFASVRTPLPILFGHDPNDAIGVWESAAETATGFVVKGRLLVEDMPRAREVRALVRSGAVSGLSIGFSTRKAAPRVGARGRIISALDLVEVSLVTVPSHPGARVTSAKSAASVLAIAEAITRAASALRSH